MQILSINNAKIAIEEPESGDHKVAVLFIAGMSGGVFTDRFNKLKEAILNKGYTYVPIEIWKDGKDIGTLTLRNIFSAIDDAISELQKHGYNDFYAIGKSFGGGMLLARNHTLIKKLVLWAPAIGVGEKTTIPDLYDLPLDKIKSISDIVLGYGDLATIKTSVAILQGDKDTAVPKSVSEKLSNLIPNAHFEIIQDMEHSPKNETQENMLIKETIIALGK